MVGLLESLAVHIEKETGLKVFIEPQPVNIQEPHVRILAKSFSFIGEGQTDNYMAGQYTVELNLLVTLLGFGDGPDKFLSAVLEASFKLGKLFERPFSVHLIQNDRAETKPTGNFTVQAQKSSGGHFSQNAEEGAMPYRYEENFEVSLYFPYSSLI